MATGRATGGGGGGGNIPAAKVGQCVTRSLLMTHVVPKGIAEVDLLDFATPRCCWCRCSASINNSVSVVGVVINYLPVASPGKRG